MKQLSGSDTFFLSGERGNVYNHIALLMIYDISTAPNGTVRFKDVMRHFEDRLYAHPIFRRRLVTPPLGIDRPYWIEDKAIDVEFHIRHIALPKPGDWRQLMIQVARLNSRPLDRSRPLWEAYIIEGLDNIPKLPAGSFAMLLKLHHSAVDDMAGVLLTEQLHATSPQVVAVDAGPQMITLEKPPVKLELVSNAFANAFDRISDAALFGYRAAALAVALGKEQLERISGARDDTAVLPHPPHTRFNNEISANRVVEGFGMPHSRINLVRAKVPGASANDVVLATVSGALRNYLSRRRELRQESLVAYMPMDMGTPDASGARAESRPALVQLHSDIADPIERLRAIADNSSKAPLDTEAMGSALISELLDVAPAFVSNFVVNTLITRNYNLPVTTVAGPDQPLYLAGAKAMCLYSFGMPIDGAGVVISGVSYNRVTWVSMVACRDVLPDPAEFLGCLQAAWNELLDAEVSLAALAATAPARSKRRAVRKPKQTVSGNKPTRKRAA